MSNQLKHIAIIMDGNGRWAKLKGLPRSAGHKKGAEVLQNIAEFAANNNIEYLTVYAFSTENWHRPKEEVDYLMNLLRQYLKSDIKELQQRGARIRFIGERSMLSPDIITQMEKIEEETFNNNKFTFCIALSYGSRQEIVSAVRKIATSIKNNQINISDINESLVGNNLYTSGIPDPDILIRTSGEERISNYLLWQIAYSELFFTPTLWPDFTTAELQDIIDRYQSRERRYGKI